ncbi:MAG: diguanylate cyclase [Parasphingorhabdus sp.]
MKLEKAQDSSNSAWRQIWTKIAVPDSIRADLISLQHERIGALIPILYFTIATIAIVAASASGGGFDPMYHVVLPGGFVGMGIFRCWIWYSRKHKPVDLENAEKHLHSTTRIALVMGLVGGLWTLDAYYDTVEARRILAPVFVFMLTFAAVICLSSLPKAALGAMLTALGLPSIAMIISPDAGIQAMGISLLLVSLLMAGLVLANFAQTISSLQLKQELEILATTDVLTGLANRRAFSERLEEEVHIADQKDETTGFAVLMIDLDGFKSVNDTFGHVAGDELLCEVANRLQKICGHARSIARLGGDEFALIVAAATNSLLKDQSSAIKAMLSLPYEVEGSQVVISASIGSARYPGDGLEIPKLLRIADQALYKDKFGSTKFGQAASGK